MKRNIISVCVSAVLAIVIAVIGASAGIHGDDDQNASKTPYDDTPLFEAVATNNDGEKSKMSLSDITVSDAFENDLMTDSEVKTEAESVACLPSDDLTEAETNEDENKTVILPPVYPDGSNKYLLFLNGTKILEESTREIDGVKYLPLIEFCRLISKDISFEEKLLFANVVFNGIEINATVGENYITLGERVLWCGKNGCVKELGGIICVPAESICHAFELKYEDNGNGVAVVGNPTLLSAEEKYNSDDLYWLSHIISAESRGEPLEGQIAVGCVVLNRLRELDYLNSVYEVVFDRKYGIQFSPAYSGSVYSEPTESSLRAAKICLEGYSLSNEIFYFININDTPAEWLKNRCKLIMTIANHDFYA